MPITAISEKLNERIEANLEESEASDNDGETVRNSSAVDSKQLVYLGQYLRTCVTSTAEVSSVSKDGGRTRKHISLTLDPQHTNRSLAPSAIPLNCMIQASIVSIEDHGLVMDLGLEEQTVKGFLPKQEYPPQLSSAALQIGLVLLCLVTSISSNGKVLKLTANHPKVGDLVKDRRVFVAPTVDSLLPGTAVEVVITQSSEASFAGKVLGMLNATADNVHCGAGPEGISPASTYPAGSKVIARVIFALTESGNSSIGVSVLNHVLRLGGLTSPGRHSDGSNHPRIALSSTVEEAEVKHAEPGLGLYLDLGRDRNAGFVHTSRISDRKFDPSSKEAEAYKLGTQHRARVLGYNSLDRLYLLSLQQTILEKQYLRVDDIPVSALVQAKIERLIVGSKGVQGVVLHLDDTLVGLVPEVHLSDVQLQHPERKFKPGMTVPARVMSTDPDQRRLRLTLKKSLLDSAKQYWARYDQITPGDTSLGTAIKLLSSGAVIEFFGGVRGFLPVAEMSETYIQNPSTHFRVGQTVNVKATEVDPGERKLRVSCRLTSSADPLDDKAFQELRLGQIVRGTITEKSTEDLTIDLEGTNLRTTLPFVHLGDGPPQKAAAWGKRVRVGQILSDLVIIDIFTKKRSVVLSGKPSLVKAAQENKLITSFEDVSEGDYVDGFVRNVTEDGIFVQFAAGLTGLLRKSQVSDEKAKITNFDLEMGQSLKARVLSADPAKKLFWLTMKGPKADLPNDEKHPIEPIYLDAVNPVSDQLKSITDLKPEYVTKARITSVKDTQLNVLIADNIQGRIDVSELFVSWDDIKDRKKPSRQFRSKQVLDVKVLGIHDARNHRFLPISHRSGKVSVFELSAKTQAETHLTSLDKIEVGSQHIAFVNNISDTSLWVNISPNVRGRLGRIEVSDNVSLINNLESHFPIGSAIRVRVKHVDLEKGHLDLTGKSSLSSAKALSLDILSVGSILPARVTKTNERSVWAQLSPEVVGHIGLTEIADDYDNADPTKFGKNQIIRVCVVDIDAPNKKISLTTRPSKVLSSSLPVKDKLLTSSSQLKVNDLVRGFIKNIADIGLFIALGPGLSAFVRVAELSDSYIKDWKSKFEIDRMVKGKVVSVDETTKQVQMSLKESVVSNEYIPLKTFNDVNTEDVVTGKIRAVKDFGVFIVVDNSNNVSGLCHRSQIADGPVEDVTKLYGEGDVVKAKVLKVDRAKRRISFGLKAKYFTSNSDDESGASENGSDLAYAADDLEGEAASDDGGVELDMEQSALTPASSRSDQEDIAVRVNGTKTTENSEDDDQAGLDAGGFNWTGSLPKDNEDVDSEPEGPDQLPKKSKKRVPQIQVDRTGDLDQAPPETASDFERLLLGQRDDPVLWMQYMSHYLKLGETDDARNIAERALREIGITRQQEKLDVWTAYLNLEEAYGSEETLEEVFRRACGHTDRQEIHERLVNIYIKAGRIDVSSRTLPPP